MSVSSHQVRAARALLEMTQDDLAAASKVGIATIRRFENGAEIGEPLLDALQRALEAAGAIFISAGASLGVTSIGEGVARRHHARQKR